MMSFPATLAFLLYISDAAVRFWPVFRVACGPFCQAGSPHPLDARHRSPNIVRRIVSGDVKRVRLVCPVEVVHGDF